MLSANVEQYVNIKFLTKLGKSATETYNLLTEVYGDQCLSRTQIFEWFKKFKEGRKYVGDNPKSGRPSTAKTQENVEKVARIVRGDRRLSIRTISELTNINKESVRQICTKIWARKRCVLKWCQQSLPLSKRNIEAIAVMTLFKTLKMILISF